MSETTYNVIAPEHGVPVKAWTKGVQLEDEARKQLLNAAQLPFIFKWIAAMPDVHWGVGATVGSVIPTKGAIVPAAVGVDLGCGVNAARLSLTAKDLPTSLVKIRSAIERAVPVGFETHGDKRDPDREDAAKKLERGLRKIVAANPKIESMQKDFRHAWIKQLGTLGGGNHFIELCLDEEQNV